MKISIFIALALAISFVSCKRTPGDLEKLEIASKYYQALDNSDGTMISVLLADSIATLESDYDYRQTFSRNQYVQNWLRWDSVFRPSYTILEIRQENELVRARISKTDKRIHFLHGEPTVWNEVLRFKEARIASIERTNVVFNEKVWQKNVSNLVKWINDNHPELNGFLNDQTKEGGMKYLQAIELYENKK